MRLPKTVTVLGEVYKIKLVTGLMEADGVEGFCDAHLYMICIDKSIKKRALAKVYWHEVGHAFAYESGLHEFLSPQAREMFAQTFSNFMCKIPR